MDVHFAEKKSIVFHGLVDFATRSAIISPDLSILSFLIQHMGKVLVFGALEGLHKPTTSWLGGAACLCCFRGWFRFCL